MLMPRKVPRCRKGARTRHFPHAKRGRHRCRPPLPRPRSLHPHRERCRFRVSVARVGRDPLASLSTRDPGGQRGVRVAPSTLPRSRSGEAAFPVKKRAPRPSRHQYPCSSSQATAQPGHFWKPVSGHRPATACATAVPSPCPSLRRDRRLVSLRHLGTFRGISI